MPAGVNGLVHIYGEHGKLITRSAVFQKKGFETPTKREGVAKLLNTQHEKIGNEQSKNSCLKCNHG
jgi:hypothetical protein